MDQTTMVGAPLVSVRNIRQAYHKDASTELIVLDDVNLTLQSGEIVGLLGR
jgi:NitT/TauT family transport system ATP-binding protein